MNFGFLNDKNYIPEIYSHLSMEQVARIFLTFYNFNVDKKLKIPYKFSKNCKNLRDIFDNFISSSLKNRNLKFNKASKICLYSNKIIFSYLKNKNFTLQAKLPKYRLALVILMLKACGEFGLIFDMRKLFIDFVYAKILAKNKNEKIFLKDNLIIFDCEKFKLGILPICKNVSKDEISKFKEDIKCAFEILKKEGLDMIYLAYPKNENFKRHIEIKCENSDICTMKLVPYCISNKIFMRR